MCNVCLKLGGSQLSVQCKCKEECVDDHIVHCLASDSYLSLDFKNMICY